MICKTHTDPESGRVWLTYHRDKWQEWFSFYCHPDYVEEFRKAPFSWLYVALRDNTYRTMNLQMVLAPVALFILLRRGFVFLWFFPARILYRAGWLAKRKEGEQVHWFWFRYISRQKPIA